MNIVAFLTAGVLMCAFAEVSFAQLKNEPKMYKVGKAVVWAIADSTGERDTSTFSSFADEKTLKEYMPTGKVPTAIMCFLIKTGNEIILIDTGMGSPSGDRASRLMPALSKIGIKPEQINLILITHMHIDHIGGLIWNDKPAFPNAKIKIGRIERDFWIDDKSIEKFPARKAGFDLAKRVVNMYGNAVGVFEFGDTVAPGITAMDARGHTPGQTAFMLESDGQKLLFIGDLLHAAALQFPRPDISGNYDMNPKESVESREKFLAMAANDKLTIAGAHLPFPAVGKVEKNGKGGYKFNPE